MSVRLVTIAPFPASVGASARRGTDCEQHVGLTLRRSPRWGAAKTSGHSVDIDSSSGDNSFMMTARFLNFFLLLLWLSAGVALLFRDSYLAEEYRTPEWSRKLDLATIGAFVLAAWNLARLSLQRTRDRLSSRVDREGIRRPATTPLQKNPEVIHPEFDFSAPDKPPEPPLNGKHPHSS